MFFKTVSQCVWQGAAIGILLGIAGFAGPAVALGVAILFGLVFYALHWVETRVEFSSIEEETPIPTDEERKAATKMFWIVSFVLVIILALLVGM